MVEAQETLKSEPQPKTFLTSLQSLVVSRAAKYLPWEISKSDCDYRYYSFNMSGFRIRIKLSLHFLLSPSFESQISLEVALHTF